MKLDPKEYEYENAIPDCCHFKTYWEHVNYLCFCWGLLSAIERKEKMECGECEFATRKKAGNE